MAGPNVAMTATEADGSAARAVGASRRFRLGVLAAVLLSIAFRIRFVFVAITTDEGGYLAVARAWRHGATPFVDVWVDRPQGLWAVYAAFDALVGDARWVRLLSLLFGALGVVAVGWAVRLAASDSAGVAAAVATAVASSGPTIEGYAANGELLSASVGAAAVAIAIAVLVGRLGPRWMGAAGVVGGLAWSIKQSGVDGPLAVCVWLVVAAIAGWLQWRAAFAHLARFAGGACVVLLLAMLHGASVGFSDWWYAIAGYRLEQRSVLTGAKWSNLGLTFPKAAPLLLPVLVLGAGIALMARRTGKPVLATKPAAVLLLWPLCALLTFAMGGQFFRHYWVTLTFPVAALGGMLVAASSATARRAALVVVVLAAAVPWAQLAFLDGTDVPLEAGDGSRLTAAEHVGRWLADRTEPGDTVYVMCAAANTYAYAGVDPPVRYLWSDGIRRAKGAQAELSALFADSPPTWLVMFDKVTFCSADPLVATVIAERYAGAIELDGVRILRLEDDG